MADENNTPNNEPIDEFRIPASPLSPNLMSDLVSDELLSADRISGLMEDFVREFTKRYPTSGPPLYMGPLVDALAHSLYNQTDARPLILFIYHGSSVNTHLFCGQVLCKTDITNYIEENFLVWAWDATVEINYQRLLTMLQVNLGDKVKETVASSPIDTFPLLICLAYNGGGVEITNIIRGYVPHDLTLEFLKEARDRFDFRIETPNSAGPLWLSVTNEHWSMSPSVLQSIEKTSEDFERIATEFARQTEHVIELNKIENSSWSSQYSQKKTDIIQSRPQIGNQVEQTLVFPCSQARAKHILQYGFVTDNIVTTYRHGLHFQSPDAYKRNYLPFDPANDSLNALLICHVLVGQPCHKDRIIHTSPIAYDSTMDGSGTYIVVSNRSVLPIYYLKY